jgi:hypothetical protein
MQLRPSKFWVIVLVLSAGTFCFAGDDREEVFKGEISDSQCAFNVHSATRSHDEMLKTKTMGSTPADCVRICVKNLGGQFVLQTKDKVYKLDNQYLAGKTPAQKVKVSGVLDPKTNTITVKSIDPLQE